MNKSTFSFVFILIFSVSLSPIILTEIYAQENVVIPPRQQWKEISDIDQLTCKEGLLLLQKNNGAPSCVSSSAYLKLVDRGYGMFDSEIMMKRPMMMNNLIERMTSDQMIMNHWHEMMINDKTMMQKTMQDWISQMKDNPKFLANMMGPMTSDANLREQMIETMKQHGVMMSSLQGHPRWMDSVHDEMMGSGMGQNQGHGMHMNCSWCPEYEEHYTHEHSRSFSHSDRIMDMMHHMWINNEMTTDMHDYMIENPSHMAQMSGQMMGPMLGHMMDDPELRQQMIEMMLEHPEFMNSIRHENRLSN
ncbi:MAG: hypothetical protein ACO2Y5_05435 [Nitrosopumilaceae archaeon]